MPGSYALVQCIRPMQSHREFETHPLIKRFRDENATSEQMFEAMRKHDPKIIWTPHVVECNALIDYLLKHFPQWLHWLPMKFPDDPEAPLGMSQYVGKTALDHQRDLALKAYNAGNIGLTTQHLERMGILEHHGRDHSEVSASVDAMMPALKEAISAALTDHSRMMAEQEEMVRMMPAHFTVIEPDDACNTVLHLVAPGCYAGECDAQNLTFELNLHSTHGTPELVVTKHTTTDAMPLRMAQHSASRYSGPDKMLVFHMSDDRKYTLSPPKEPVAEATAPPKEPVVPKERKPARRHLKNQCQHWMTMTIFTPAPGVKQCHPPPLRPSTHLERRLPIKILKK